MSISPDDIQTAPGHESNGEDLFFQHFIKDLPKEEASPGAEDHLLRQRALKHLAAQDESAAEEPPAPDEPEEVPSEETEKEERAEQQEDERLYLDSEDNVYTKVKVGEEEHEVALKDLKRLHGQEAALTQRSQQLAESRRTLEQREATHIVASQQMLDYFRQQLRPFMDLDFVKIAQDRSVPPQELAALQREAQARYQTVQFLEHQQDELMQRIRDRQDTEMQQQAVRCISELRDPASPHYIEGWDQPMYDGLRSYAIGKGLSANVVNTIVDPAALTILRKAQLYDEGKSALVKTTKVNKTVTKVTKSTRAIPSSMRGPGGEVSKALAKLSKTGDVDDAADAFLAKFREYGINDN